MSATATTKLSPKNEGQTYQVTEYEDRHTVIKTQWGKLEYERWLQCEIERWYDKDFRVAWVEVDKKTGHVAMFTPAKNMNLIDDIDNE